MKLAGAVRETPARKFHPLVVSSAVRYAGAEPLALRRPGRRGGSSSGDARFVDEHQALGIEIHLASKSPGHRRGAWFLALASASVSQLIA